MKKIAYLFVIAIIFTLFGCVTTSSVSINPSEIEYKEIDGKNYFSSRDSELYFAHKGYKITDVFLLDADTRNENGTTEALLKLATDKNGWGDEVRYVYATDFIKNLVETDPTWGDRVDAVANNQKYNGHYTVYVYGKTEGDFLVGYTTKVTAFNIEGVPSQEQIEADKAAEEAEQLAKEEADKKAKAEK